MGIATENRIHTSTRDYVPFPVSPNHEYPSGRLRAMMRRHKNLLGSRTSVALAGIPAGLDLHTMIPPTSYIEGEDGFTNLSSIVEILYRAKAKVNGKMELSPVQKVIQDEAGRWRLISRTHYAKALIEWSKVIVTLLPVYIVEVTGMITPTVTIDSTMAKEHAAKVKQEMVVEKPDSLRILMDTGEAGRDDQQSQEEEATKSYLV